MRGGREVDAYDVVWLNVGGQTLGMVVWTFRTEEDGISSLEGSDRESHEILSETSKFLCSFLNLPLCLEC